MYFNDFVCCLAWFVKSVQRLVKNVMVTTGSEIIEYDEKNEFSINNESVEIRYWNS